MKQLSLRSSTDEELVKLFCSTGAQRYFEALYQRYNRKVYHKCLQITKDEYLAQDYTQDVFVQLIEKISHFQGRSTFSTWLYSLTRNYCLTRIRGGGPLSASKSVPLENLELIADEYGDAVDPKLYLLPRALEVLTSDEARLLVMRYYEGLDLTEISQQLTLSISAIKMRLNRSRAKLKKQILTWADA